MPKFTCPHCLADLTDRAAHVLTANVAVYMPYTVRLLCAACGRLTTFALGYALVKAEAQPEVIHVD